ncbi:MAG: hypothetical protein P9M03_00965 [Candidatus Theseobacter exili]|nr:hypothetical protein [Candidatus Theseobacter exili]
MKIATSLLIGSTTICLIISHANAYAGDKEWATAGKILTGVVGLGIISNLAARPSPHRYSPRRHYRYPKPVYQPAPCTTWIPEHYEYRNERVWIPERVKEKWIPPKYEWVQTRYGWQQICVREGFFRRNIISGHFEMLRAHAWIPGHWA